MNRLIEIRVADALESIERIEPAMLRALNRRSAAESLAEELSFLIQASGWIEKVDALVRKCRQIVNFPRPGWRIEQDTVTAAEVAWKDLNEKLIQVQKNASALGESEFKENPFVKQFERHKVRAVKVLDDRREKLEVIHAELATLKFDPAQSLKSIEQEKPFWGEHIESVAGFVLRDEGYDDKLSKHADEIIRLCAGKKAGPAKETLNVLGGDQTVRRDLSQTVYFRFPAWSVWGLPLTAHDFWEASGRGGPTIRRQLKDIHQAATVWEEPLVQDCLADAFATYVIGPAYAFARVVLRLNAHSTEDQLRAQTIFAALDSTFGGGDENSMSLDLARCWTDAGGAADATSPGMPPCLLGRRCHIVDQLLKAYWAPRESPGDLEKATEQLAKMIANTDCPSTGAGASCPMRGSALMAKMRDGLLEALPSELRSPRDEWYSVCDDLMNYLTGAQKTYPQQSYDLRHILHAAWLVRWTAKEQKAAYIKDLAERTIQLAEEAANRGGGPPIWTDLLGSNQV